MHDCIYTWCTYARFRYVIMCVLYVHFWQLGVYVCIRRPRFTSHDGSLCVYVCIRRPRFTSHDGSAEAQEKVPLFVFFIDGSATKVSCVCVNIFIRVHTNVHIHIHTHTHTHTHTRTQATLRVHYNSNIVEFWSAAWRKMDSDQVCIGVCVSPVLFVFRV